MGLAMPQVSGRRADQLGDLVAVLELGAVDLDHGAGIAGEALGHGFHGPGFSRAGWVPETAGFRRAFQRWTSRP